MTFGLLSTGLGWLLMAAAAAAAIAVFLIRPRPPQYEVGSLLVWQRVLDQMRERSLWDRIRWVVSLLLTAAVAITIALALLRPAGGSRAAQAGRLLIVLDSSWSMRARTPSGGTRWDTAVAEARALITASTARDVAIATTAEGVVQGPTADLAIVGAVLSRLAPNGGAEGAWPRIAGADEVHFFTDGAHARITASDVIVHSVFVPASNVALTAFEVQPVRAGDTTAEAFVSVANFGTSRQSVRLAVTRADAVLLDRTLSIEPSATHRELLAVPLAGDPRFRAHVTAATDALDLDDDATAWLWASEPLKVGVVGAGSPIPAVLAEDASLRIYAVTPEQYAKTDADVFVFDRWAPDRAPSRPAVLIDPPNASWLGARGGEEVDPVWRPGAGHRILDGVDTSLIDLGRARVIQRPSLEPIAVSGKGTPLVAIEDSNAGRYVTLAFSTAESNVLATPAFPILLGNAIDWLGRPERDLRREPGPILLPATTTRVLAPDGRTLPLVNLDSRVTADLARPGLYLVESAGVSHVVRVALGDPSRSNLLVSTLPEGRPPSGSPPEQGRAWWLYAAAAALGLATLEWVTWQRRVTV